VSLSASLQAWLAAGKGATAAHLWLFQPGATGSLVAVLLFGIVVYVMIQRARAGAPMRQIHPLPGIDAIDEAIGRATEMGRPVFYSSGDTGVTDPMTIAHYPILAHVARRCARYDTRLLQPNEDPVVYTVNDSIVREAYLEAGRPEAFNPDDVWFMNNSSGYITGVWDLMQKQRPAASILYGDFYYDAIMLVEMGGLVGAVQIGATAQIPELPFFVAGCDYALIAEEMYAASAYIGHEPVLTGTVVAEDLYKFAMFVLIVVGAVWLSIVGSTPFSSFVHF
jgi:hypothetical protein